MRAIVGAAVLMILSEAALAVQDPLTPARDLYASAAYEEALSTLDNLGSGLSPAIDRQANEYRAFCLFALGRTNEAIAVVETVVRQDPLAPLTAADASPRLEQMFSQVRKRLLPTLIRDRFKSARGLVEEKNYAGAEPQLIEARLLIAEAGKSGIADETLSDLSVLVDGFLQLIQTTKATRAAAEAPAPAAASGVAASASGPPGASPAAGPPAAAPPAMNSQTVALPPAKSGAAAPTRPSSPPVVAPPPANSQAVALPPASSQAVAQPPAPRFYTAADEGITPPVVLEQRHPLLTNEMKAIIRAWQMRGVLSVMIDETGRVVDAAIRPSLNASFDAVILGTVRQWKYLPAKMDGVAVRYLKMVALVP